MRSIEITPTVSLMIQDKDTGYRMRFMFIYIDISRGYKDNIEDSSRIQDIYLGDTRIVLKIVLFCLSIGYRIYTYGIQG